VSFAIEPVSLCLHHSFDDREYAYKLIVYVCQGIFYIFL
jgi:hypothetical protein